MPGDKGQISKNGGFLRSVADWFEKMADEDKANMKMARKKRAIKIIDDELTGKYDAKYMAKQLGRGGGFLLLKLFELISRGTNIAFVDNATIRKAEEKYAELKHDDKKFVAWLNKHPALSSYLSYYLTLSLLALGVWGGTKTLGHQEQEVKPEIENAPESKPKQVIDVKTYDVTSPTFVQDFYTESWNDIIINLLEFETYTTKPVKNKKESVYTYGPGLTWVWEKNKQGVYIKHRCVGKYKTKADKFTEADIWEQFRAHILHETLPAVQQALIKNGYTDVPINHILALMVAGYQMPGHLYDESEDRGIVKSLKEADYDAQKCIDAFSFWLAKKKNFYDGSMKRRWWCGAIYVGYIDSHDLMDLNMDVFSAVDFNTVKPKDENFKMDVSTLVYAMSKTKDTQIVKDFIVEHNLTQNLENCYTKSPDALVFNADPSVLEMVAGIKDLRAHKYATSIEHYEKAIELNPENINAYSDLALVYKTCADTMSDRNAAINYYQKCYDQLISVKKHLRNNPDLIIDNENMAYLYYNVATAQDAVAKIAEDQGNTKIAEFMYKYARDSYKDAAAYAEQADIPDKTIKMYLSRKEDAEQHYKKVKNQKIAAFRQGNIKVKNKIMNEHPLSSQSVDNEYA